MDRFKRVESCHDIIILITVHQPRERLSVGFDICFSLYYLVPTEASLFGLSVWSL